MDAIDILKALSRDNLLIVANFFADKANEEGVSQKDRDTMVMAQMYSIEPARPKTAPPPMKTASVKAVA